MKTGPFKMKGKSPMMKALIGKQGNLPEGLKAKILASPESPAKMKKIPTLPPKKMPVGGIKREETEYLINQGMKKNLMKKESSTKMKKQSSMKMMKKSPAKLDMGTIKKVVNTKIKDIPKKVKKVVRKTAKKVGNTTIKDAVKTLSPSIKAIDAMRTGFKRSGKISQTKKKVKKSNAKGKNSILATLEQNNDRNAYRSTPTKMKKSPAKMKKKVKNPVSDKNFTGKEKGGSLAVIRALQKDLKEAKTGREKSMIRQDIASARKEGNKKAPTKMMKKSPAKLAGLAKTGAKILSKAKKAYTKFKKGKPVSKSIETNPGGKISKKTVEYKKTTDRTFYNADGTINRTSSLPNK